MVDHIRAILCDVHVFRPYNRPAILLFVLLRFSDLGSNFSMDRMEHSDRLVYIHQTRQVDRLTTPSPFRHNLCASFSRVWLLPRIY